MSERVLTERRGHILVITINRPEAKNAFDLASAQAMHAAMDLLDAEDGLFVGVITGALKNVEIAPAGLSELRVVETMHERKAVMAELSDAFIALPGGIGTFEELFEAWTWSQLGIHAKPCGLLNTAGFYDRLAGFLDHVVAEQFLKPVHRGVVCIEDDPRILLETVRRMRVTATPKWFGSDKV